MQQPDSSFHSADAHDDQDDDDDKKRKGDLSAAAAADGKGGSSCHQCKSRRNYNALTYCTASLDKKSKKCRKKFCGHCLKKFYKENPTAIASKGGDWQCPSCRKICCCAACKRRKTKGVGGHDDDLCLKTGMKKKKMMSINSAAQEAYRQALARKSYAYNMKMPPTVQMNTWEMSSPIGGALETPSGGIPGMTMGSSMGASMGGSMGGMGGMSGYDHGNLSLLPNELSDDEEDEFGRGLGLGSYAFTPDTYPRLLLGQHLKTRVMDAQEAVNAGQKSVFIRLYEQWKNKDDVNLKVRAVLGRMDLTQPKKVEQIATILRAEESRLASGKETSKATGMPSKPKFKAELKVKS